MNGTNLYFYNGSINKDLLAAGGSGPWTDGGSYVYTTAGEVINLGGITGTAYHAISDKGQLPAHLHQMMIYLLKET